MDIRRLQKYYLGNRHLFLFLIMLLSAITQARGSDATEVEIDPQTFVKDILYDYQLITRDNSDLDCVGTLYLSLSIPTDIIRLIFERTSSHDKRVPPNVFFGSLSDYPISTTNITKLKIYWGTYFRIRVMTKDNEWVYSPTYSINDYIAPSDLELLQNTSSIEDIDNDNKIVTINVKNKNLEVTSPEPIRFAIFNLQGTCIFNRENVTTETIPLSNVGSPFIIVRYSTSTNTITKKILLQ